MSQTLVDRIAVEVRGAIRRIEELHMLADQADAAGVRILATRDGASFATDPVDPYRVYRLTPDGCDCLHFVAFGRCIHNALFLSELGRIPDVTRATVDGMIEDAWRGIVAPGELPPADSPVTLVTRDGAAIAAA